VIIQKIKGATRTLGESQGYLALPIRDDVIEMKVGDQIELASAMTSEWKPTPEELAAIMAGAPIRVMVVGTVHPPISVTVGDSF
jgi:hypothetical protein